MDRSDHPLLTGLATAASFLCMVVTSTFGFTDALCGSDGYGVELAAATLSGSAFFFYLSPASR